MKKIYLIMISFYIVAFIVSINKDVSYASRQNDLFTQILSDTKSQVEEYGVKVSFKVDNNNEKQCVDILEKLGVMDNEGINVDVLKNNYQYSIEFRSKESSGYIELNNENGENFITIYIKENKSVNNLPELRYKVETAIGEKAKDNKYFQFVKAKTELTSDTEIRNTIVNELKGRDAKGIDTIKLDRATSITALTGEYEPMKVGNTFVDINCAICSYDSGRYVIIGTPVIMESY